MKLAIFALAAIAAASVANAQDSAVRAVASTRTYSISNGDVSLPPKPKTGIVTPVILVMTGPDAVEGAEVVDLLSETVLRTDSTGVMRRRFVTQNDSVAIEVRKLGFESQQVFVRVVSDTTLTFALRKLQALPEVVTTADAVRSDVEVRVRTYGGKILTTEDLQRPGLALSDVLVQNSMSPFNAVKKRGASCQPRVLLNGDAVAAKLLNLRNEPASNYAVVEFYESGSRTPAEFGSAGNASCGVVGLWTQTR